jgi:AcrR family transcriptional regulator
MQGAQDSRQRLLDRVIDHVAAHGIAGRSLREIATGVGTSHRMLLYHFGSREGLVASVVARVEERQRQVMASLAAGASTPREAMTALWEHLSSPQLRPFVRLFFEIFGLAAGGEAGARGLLPGLTGPWLSEGMAAAESVGQPADPATVRLGVAVTRGLLLDLVAGADADEVTAAYTAFIDVMEKLADCRSREAGTR